MKMMNKNGRAVKIPEEVVEEKKERVEPEGIGEL